VHYTSWLDAGGGRYDSFTCAVAHKEGDLLVQDAAVEVKAPFDTSVAVAQVVDLLRAYRLRKTMGDDYGAGFVVAEFKRHQIVCEGPAGGSVLYLEILRRSTRGGFGCGTASGRSHSSPSWSVAW
jgi:hypothetical protein